MIFLQYAREIIDGLTAEIRKINYKIQIIQSGVNFMGLLIVATYCLRTAK